MRDVKKPGIVDYRLSVFQAVAEHLSFTKASRVLHLSQPAVTQHIKVLEDEVGQPLFHRGSRGVTMTGAGALLLEHARHVARLDEEVLQRIRGKKGVISGKLSLGGTSTISQYLLPNWLVQSRRTWPDLRLKVKTGNTEEIIEAALERKLDMGLIEGRCTRVGLRTECFLDDEIICVASARNPLAQGRPLSVAALKQQTWIFREKGSGTRDIVEVALKRHGIDPRQLNIDLELSSSEAIKAVVASGYGLTFLSRFVVERELAQGRLLSLPVRGLTITRQFHFIYPQGPRPVGAAGAFFDLVLRATGKLPGRAADP
ncbi:MAG TPA: LysR family transcriptional regulator [Chthoniobacterales bacterium]